jgi:hypothetical protein
MAIMSRMQGGPTGGGNAPPGMMPQTSQAMPSPAPQLMGQRPVNQPNPPPLNPLDFMGAISRRIGEVPSEYGPNPTGATSVQPNSLLDMIIFQLEKNQMGQGMGRVTSNIPGVANPNQITEDMPQFDWRTMGNRTRGITNPLTGRMVNQSSPKRMPSKDKMGRPLKSETL